jgi:hypothetical protein
VQLQKKGPHLGLENQSGRHSRTKAQAAAEESAPAPEAG